MRTCQIVMLLAVIVGLSSGDFNLRAQGQEPSETLEATRRPSRPVAASSPNSRDLTAKSTGSARLRELGSTETGNREPPPPILPEEFVPSRLANRAMAVMGLLIVACVGAIWYGQRHSKTGRLGSSSSDLQILDTLSIAPRCCVHLLRVGGQRYLVARDQSGIKSVTAVSAFAATLDDLADKHVDSAQEAAAPSLSNRSWASRSEQWSSTLSR